MWWKIILVRIFFLSLKRISSLEEYWDNKRSKDVVGNICVIRISASPSCGGYKRSNGK